MKITITAPDKGVDKKMIQFLIENANKTGVTEVQLF